MPRQQKSIHYIYKVTCKVTNRYYIGMHSTNNIDDGYMGSGKRLRYSIRKHGKENHEKEILEFFETRELLTEREKEIITSDLVNDKSCMNLVLGGGGFMLDDYHYECSRAGGNANVKKLKNDKVYYAEFIKRSSDKLKESHKLGKIKYDTFTGKEHSVESKTKIGNKNSVKQLGEGNSQFGTCWITKEGENKKIKKEELGRWVDDGWVNGRKINTVL